MIICKEGVARFMIVVLLAVLALGVSAAPVHAGVSPDEGKFVGNNGAVIIGETNVNFFNESWEIIPYGTIRSRKTDISVAITFNGPFDSSAYEEELSKTDEYEVKGPNGNITVYFFAPTLDAEVKVDAVEVTKVIQGDIISFTADTNLWIISNLTFDFFIFPGPLPNYVTYKLIDPNGLQRSRVGNVSLRNIDVGFDYLGKKTLIINTADLDELGSYKLSLTTDPETNNGLDKEGKPVSFELVRVVKEEAPTYITIEAEPEKQTVHEKVIITAITTPNTNITLNVTSGNEINVLFKDDRGDVSKGGIGSAFGKSDKNGVFKAAVYFSDTGSYEITANELKYNTYDSVIVKIVGFTSELKTDKSVYHIGEDVEISGSTNGGTDVTIKIDDEVITEGLPVTGDTFSYTWGKTEDKAPGSYKIAVWVLPQSDPERDLPDAWTTIVLIRGGLFVETSADFVAKGDDFKITGTAPGRDRVDILTIAPKGGGGEGFLAKYWGNALDAPGITYSSYSVENDEFETEKIKVAEDVDTGTYLILALNYGRDGEWGTSRESNLLRAISNDYTTPLGVKTTDQILAIVKDRTIDAPGTDDLLGLTTIKVEQGFVTVDALADVPLGSDIKVTGTTNRQEDTAIIVTVEGMDERTPSLKPQIEEVDTNDKIYYNSFEATFATKSANLGEYIVTVDDGDGHTASTTLSILQAVEPAVNVSATRPLTSGGAEVNESVAETPVPTPTMQPTITPSEPPAMESTPVPGFLSLGIVLMILWLVIAIIIAVWVYRDATEHGQNGVLWVIIVLILSVVGLLIWLVKRKSFGQLARRPKMK